ncbi:MAG TPA: oligoendopeptidase [Lentisphaeria bacterium]|nr:oligoendopeptidase [Lentisphaeria bacterium]
MSTLPTWNLDDLYTSPTDPKLSEDLSQLSVEADDFAAQWRGKLGQDAATLRAALDHYEAFQRKAAKPSCYASLLFSTDLNDPERGALLQSVREAITALSGKLVFFDLELAELPEERLTELMADDQLAPYGHYLKTVVAQAKYNLSEPEEKILVATSPVRGSAFGRLFSEIHSRAVYRMSVDGEEQTLTQSEILAKVYSSDRAERAAAAAAVTTTLKEHAHPLTFIYNTLLNERQITDRLRGIERPEGGRHLANELSYEVVDTMSSVCVKHYPMVARYYELKRRLLGLEELTHVDRYAPIADSRKEIAYEDAKQLVCDSFLAFSPEMHELVLPFFEQDWIDAELKPGKQGGAFCAGVTPDLHPYILMNYTGKPRDVTTLAHELGHGIHDRLAAGNHMLDYYPVLPLAETASTFAEMLVFEQLKQSLTDPAERRALLCGKLEDSFATIFRQVAMFRFEQQAHALRREQGEQTTEAYNALWQSCMQEMFGDSVKLGDEHAWWWLYIPHIYRSPFYVYAYAFGELLVLSLYARYKEQGASFIPSFFELLAAGGSEKPEDLLKRLDIDVSDKTFWAGGCSVLAATLEELEALC